MFTSGNTVLPVSETLQPFAENSTPFYRFHLLSRFAELEHRVFTRLGGTSLPPFASLNVSYDTGDDALRVRENIHRIRNATECSSFIYARQSHSSNLVVLRKYPRFDSRVDYPLHGKDGFFTQLPGLLMTTKESPLKLSGRITDPSVYSRHKQFSANGRLRLRVNRQT